MFFCIVLFYVMSLLCSGVVGDLREWLMSPAVSSVSLPETVVNFGESSAPALSHPLLLTVYLNPRPGLPHLQALGWVLELSGLYGVRCTRNS